MTEKTLGLRERKKQEMRVRIARAAWMLTIEHGYANVRIEDIAAAADVSLRTFSNYFPSKEAALIALGEDRGARLVGVLRSRPEEEPPWTAIARTLSESFGGDGEVPRAIVGAVPDVAEFLAVQRRVQGVVTRTLAVAIAERANLDVDRDLFPRLAAGVALGATDAALEHWLVSDSEQSFPEFLYLVLVQVGDGLASPAPATYKGEL